jgi:hypothetical protein
MKITFTEEELTNIRTLYNLMRESNAVLIETNEEMADLIYANAYVDFQYDGRLEVDDADYIKRRISIIQAHSKQT